MWRTTIKKAEFSALLPQDRRVLSLGPWAAPPKVRPTPRPRGTVADGKGRTPGRMGETLGRSSPPAPWAQDCKDSSQRLVMTLTCSVRDKDQDPTRPFEFVLPNEDNLQVAEEEQVCQSPHARRRPRSAAIPLRSTFKASRSLCLSDNS